MQDKLLRHDAIDMSQREFLNEIEACVPCLEFAEVFLSVQLQVDKYSEFYILVESKPRTLLIRALRSRASRYSN